MAAAVFNAVSSALCVISCVVVLCFWFISCFIFVVFEPSPPDRNIQIRGWPDLCVKFQIRKRHNPVALRSVELISGMSLVGVQRKHLEPCWPI